jgi:hypothetical protein
MRDFLRTAALMTTCVAAPAMADMSPVVVELYTSQGCSSCPPADEMLTELSARDDVIALALHVDYWDYIGWVDDFANPAFTQRQQDYARAAGETTIYTPQFVVAGADIVVGARGMDVADLIAAHKIIEQPVDVTLEWTGDTLSISAVSADADAAGDYVVQLAQILPVQSVEIRRGENSGKTIQYSNVVQELGVIDQWDGTAPFSFEADVTGADQVAVIVQRGTNGPVVGAAKLIN